MPKEPKKPKESQHDKFVKIARESGADESEDAFVGNLRKIAPDKSPSTSGKAAKPKGRET